MATRLVCALAILVVAAIISCAVAGYALLHQADERHAVKHRTALVAAVETLRAKHGGSLDFDASVLARLERIAAVRDLRFEHAPAQEGRDLQSVLDAQGRIVGWLSWRSPRSLAEVTSGLSPLLLLTGLFVLGFAGIALWQVRRTMVDLEASERRAWSLAHEDALTGLPNQRSLMETIDTALAQRAPDGVVTLALVDIDGLDAINEDHGHRAGDELVAAWAARLRGAAGPVGACGRLDGDQFAIVVAATGPDAAEPELKTIAAALGQPFWIAGRVVQIGSTMGFAQAPSHAASRDELMRRAEIALRAGKRRSRGGVTRFEPAMDAEVSERRFIERELKRALDDETLDVHYQPIVAADGARVVGAEALLRWNHRTRGAIAPSSFVPVAEQTGLMGRLGAFVLRRALADAMRWPDIFIAVNLSPVQVRDPALVDLVKGVLAQTKLPPQRLVLEVTEGVLIDNPDEAKARLDALRALGLRLALDDFGTGYSSLTYLQRFRFDKLKIDKGFVAPLGASADSQAIMHSIVGLGRALGLSMLAEGVETEEQRVLLRLAGCEEMQGFLFAKPAPREAMARLLAGDGAMRAIRRAG